MEGDGCLVPEVAVSYLAFWMEIQRAFSAQLGSPADACSSNSLPN